MKKVVAILLAFIIVISIIGCNKKEMSADAENTRFDTGTASDLIPNTESTDDSDSESTMDIYVNIFFDTDREVNDVEEYYRVVNCRRNSSFAHYDEISYLGQFALFSYKIGCLECESPELDTEEYSYDLRNGDFFIRFTSTQHDPQLFKQNGSYSKLITKDASFIKEEHDLRDLDDIGWELRNTASETSILKIPSSSFATYAEYDNTTGKLLRIYVKEFFSLGVLEKEDYPIAGDKYLIIDFSITKGKNISDYDMSNEAINNLLCSNKIESEIFKLFQRVYGLNLES